MIKINLQSKWPFKINDVFLIILSFFLHLEDQPTIFLFYQLQMCFWHFFFFFISLKVLTVNTMDSIADETVFTHTHTQS